MNPLRENALLYGWFGCDRVEHDKFVDDALIR